MLVVNVVCREGGNSAGLHGSSGGYNTAMANCPHLVFAKFSDRLYKTVYGLI